MSLDEENVAPIEKDLMRDYVKQLYDAFLQSEEHAVPVTPTPRRVATPKPTYTQPAVVRQKVATPPPPVVKTIPVVKTAPPPAVVETVHVVNTPPPPPPPPPVVEEVVATRTVPVTPSVVAQKPVIAVPTPRPQKAATNYAAVDPEHADLFDINLDSKELSEKLSLTKINDLNNAMGLNERIFTVNELFGADNSLYRNTIRDLNALNSFDEAKAYLSSNVAEKFNWTQKNKRNKAKIFIKLVRRRYL